MKAGVNKKSRLVVRTIMDTGQFQNRDTVSLFSSFDRQFQKNNL